MTYRFEDEDYTEKSALDAVMRVNARIAGAHRQGGQLINVSINIVGGIMADYTAVSAEEGTFKVYLKFRYEEKAA